MEVDCEREAGFGLAEEDGFGKPLLPFNFRFRLEGPCSSFLSVSGSEFSSSSPEEGIEAKLGVCDDCLMASEMDIFLGVSGGVVDLEFTDEAAKTNKSALTTLTR